MRKNYFIITLLFLTAAISYAQESLTDTLSATYINAEVSHIKTTKTGNVKVIVAGSYLSNLSEMRDVLRRTPGLNVNSEQIEVIGKGVPLIIIDGRETNVAELMSLSPNNIANIEVIRAPSSNYDANVRSVIKVRTTLQAKETSAQIYNHSFYGRAFRDNPGIKLQFATDKSVNYLSYDYSSQKYRQFATTIDKILLEQETYKDSAKINNIYRNNNHSIIYGGKANLAEKHSIMWQYSGTFAANNTEYTTKEFINYIKESNNEYNTIKNSESNKTTHIADIGYEYIIDSLRTLRADVQYSFVSPQKNEIINGGVISPLIIDNYGHSHVLAANAQYNKSFKSFDFLSGLKFSTINSNQSVAYDGQYTNTLFKSHLLAMYFSANKDYDYWGWNIGIRAEYLQDKTNTFSKTYFNVFPSVNYYIEDIFPWLNTLDVSFTSRIRRPQLTELSPAYTYNNIFVISKGNPQLKPSVTNELALTLNMFDCLTFSCEQDWVTRPIVETGEIDMMEGVVFYSPLNIGKSSLLYTYLEYSNKWKWLNVSSAIGCSFPKTYVNILGTETLLRKPSLDASITIDAVLNKGTTFSLGGDYYMDYYDNITHFGSTSNIIFGVSQDFFNNRMNVSLYINDIFKTLSSDWEESFKNYFSKMDTDYDTRYIRLSIRYNFNNFKSKYDTIRQSSELNRVK